MANVTVFLCALVSCTLVGGCSSQTPEIAQKPVSISLFELAKTQPEWQDVIRFDTISRQTTSSVNVSSLTSLNASDVHLTSASGTVSPIDMNRIHSEETAQQNAMSNRVKNAIDQRLQRIETTRIAEAEQQSNERLSLAISSGDQNSSSDFLERSDSTIRKQADEITSLRVQIAALTADALPTTEATAPDDTWGKLRDSKIAQLNALQDKIRNEKAQLRAAVYLESVEAHKKLADEEKIKLDAQRLQIREQIAQTRSKTFSAIDQSRDRILRSSTDEMSSAAGGPLAANESEIGSVAPVISPNSNSARSIELTEISQERSRLISSILIDVRRKTLRSAKSLGYKIVDWESSKPDTEAMSKLVEQINGDNTNKS